MSFNEYVEWLEEHSTLIESGTWYIAELDLNGKPQLAEQGQTKREALENLAKRYQKYTERESNELSDIAEAKKKVGPSFLESDKRLDE